MITGCVLARNESKHIVSCLETLKPHVEQLILIDMESEDDTCALAQPLVDQVLSHPLVSNFDCARNLAIEQSEHDWLFYLDADERLPQQTGEIVRDLIGRFGDQFEAITIPFKTFFCGKWIEHSGWWPGYTMPRVLKKGKFKFSERLHGGVEFDGREYRIPPDPNLAIEHFSYDSIEHYLTKLNRYTSTEAKQLATDGNSSTWETAIGHMVHDLWMYYELNQGHLDGQHGWMLAWLSGQYRWLQHSKLIDELPGTDAGRPENLDQVLEVFQSQLHRLRAKRPVLPLGIVWRSPLLDPSGYAEEGRTLVKALARGGRQLCAHEIRWNDTLAEIDVNDQALLRALTSAKRPSHSIAITDCIPTLVQPDPEACLNVLRTTFETDRIPEGWLAPIDAFDEVWVISEHNRRAFIGGGVAPERLRVVPSCVDAEKYLNHTGGFEFPETLTDRFILLSIFDWQYRKGWDVLLRAYAKQFSVDDGVGLFLKITRSHGQTHNHVVAQIDQILKSVGTSIAERTDIFVTDELFSSDQLTALYHSAGALVMPTRGEGWGRPLMEAMASGIPVVSTAATGNGDFCDETNSFVVEGEFEPVTDAGAEEIPPYKGHKWFEPNEESLMTQLALVVEDEQERARRADRAQKHVCQNFGLDRGLDEFERAVSEAEKTLIDIPAPAVRPDQVCVEWEGELEAGHSFSNINEKLIPLLGRSDPLALRVHRVQYNPLEPRSNGLRDWSAYVDRPIDGDPQVTIRHSFPPNFQKPPGKWVHIQPWEFGHLPKEWIPPLVNDVDEVWAPSEYVKRVYEQSGIPTDKIQVIGWGVDQNVFHPRVIKRLIPTSKQFVFLFVGGSIRRKGIDLLVEAYRQEFSSSDDVCLLIKDLGTSTFYRYGNYRDEILKLRDDAECGEVMYWDQPMTPGQLASVYAAADCLVMPYRGEGFGLPILESMACGTCAIIPGMGASVDFTSDESAFLLNAKEVETSHDWPLVGPALELSIDVADLRNAMRQVYQDRELTRAKCEAAAEEASKWTWQRTAEQMVDRITKLAATSEDRSSVHGSSTVVLPTTPAIPNSSKSKLSAYVESQNNEKTLPSCLSRLSPFFDSIFVVDESSNDRSRGIAAEYGANVISTSERGNETDSGDWYIEIKADQLLSEADVERVRSVVGIQPGEIKELMLAQENGQPLSIRRTPVMQESSA